MPRAKRYSDHTLGARVPFELLEAVRAAAAAQQITVQQLVIEGLRMQLGQVPAPVPQRPPGRPRKPPAPGGFDQAKFALGKLCKRRHEYGTTGQTLRRRANNNCVECNDELQRARRAKPRGTTG